jgi:hypothetical protein
MQVAYSGGDRPSKERCCVGHVWLSREQYDALCAEAADRRIHPDRLIANVIDVVIADDLFRAVLNT